MNSGDLRVTGLALVDGLLAMVRLAHLGTFEDISDRSKLFEKILNYVDDGNRHSMAGVLPSEQITVLFVREQFKEFSAPEILQIYSQVLERRDEFRALSEEIRRGKADISLIQEQVNSLSALGAEVLTRMLDEIEERKRAEEERLAKERKAEEAQREEQRKIEAERLENLRLAQEKEMERARQEAIEVAEREKQELDDARKASEAEVRAVLDRRRKEFNFQFQSEKQGFDDYRELWTQRGLLSGKRLKRIDAKVLDLLVDGFTSQRVVLSAQRIAVETRVLPLPIFMLEGAQIKELVRYFMSLGAIKSEESTFANASRSVESARQRERMLTLFESFTRDKSEALYFLSYFIQPPLSPDQKDDPVTRPLSIALNPAMGHAPDSQVAVRLKYFLNKNEPLQEERELTVNEMVELIRSPDLFSTKELIRRLKEEGFTQSQLSNLIESTCLVETARFLLTEVSADGGDAKAQVRILRQRRKTNSFNHPERLSTREWFELADRYFEQSKNDMSLVKQYIEMYLSKERWPKEITEEMIRAQDKSIQIRLFERAIRFKLKKETLLLDELLTLQVGNPLELPEVLRALKIVSDDFVALLVSRHKTENRDLLYRATCSGALEPEQSARALAKLHQIFDQSPDPTKAAEILLVTKDKSESSSEVLELALKSENQHVIQLAVAEMAMRHYVEGRRDEAMQLAEPFAYQSLACAHLMYILQPENGEWLILIARNHNEILEEEIRLRFKSAGCMPATELDDPYLHLGLARKEEIESKERKKNDPSWIAETWFCRKRAHASQEGRIEQCPFHLTDERGPHEFKRIDGSDDPFLFTDFALDTALANLNAGSELYSWQLAALASWAEHGRHGIVEAVTGSGKSRVGALAISEALSQGYAVLVVVPTRVLSDQWMTQSLDGFRKRGLVDRIGNYATQVAHVPFSRGAQPGRITVAVLSGSVEGEVRRWMSEKDPKTRLMIVADEVHWLGRGVYQNLMKMDFSRRLGLTATLLRDEYQKSKSKNYFSGDPVFRYEFDQAIDQKVIVPFTLIMLGVSRPHDIDYKYRLLEKELRDSRETIQRYARNDKRQVVPISELYEHCLSLLKGGEKSLELLDFAQRYLKAQDQMNNLLDNSMAKTSKRAIWLISSLVRKVKRTAVFSDSLKNADNVLTIFRTKEIDCELIESRTRSHDRERIIENLDQGRIHAVVSPRVLDEGVDIKNLTVGLFTGQVRNRRALIQRLGRILRTNPGKSQAYAVILYVRGTDDDPSREANDRLQRSQFDFVGRNAQGEIRNYIVGEDDQSLLEFIESIAVENDLIEDDLMSV